MTDQKIMRYQFGGFVEWLPNRLPIRWQAILAVQDLMHGPWKDADPVTTIMILEFPQHQPFRIMRVERPVTIPIFGRVTISYFDVAPYEGRLPRVPR